MAPNKRLGNQPYGSRNLLVMTPKAKGIKNVHKPKNNERYLYCLKSLMSISLPDWNIMYSMPSEPRIWIVGLSPTIFNTDGPITIPTKINPTMLGTCILRHTSGTNHMMPITRVSISIGDRAICLYIKSFSIHFQGSSVRVFARSYNPYLP